jgi:acyl-CoA thioesterase-1
VTRPGGRQRRRAVAVLALCLALTASSGCSVSGAAPGPGRSAPVMSSASMAPVTQLTAVFLGDSYTAGVGASAPESGYAQRTAALMGWRAVVEGQGGTGYVNPSESRAQSVYTGRLARVTAAGPDVVVVQGSTNDAGRPWKSVEAAATELYGRLRVALPSARIVVLGPLAPPGVDPDAVGRIRNALARAASTAGVPFIDPIAAGWLLPADGLYADPGHPNDDGYRQLADHLARALRTAGF